MPSQPNIGSIAPKRPESFIGQRFKELQKQIDELRTARSGNAMTIDGLPGIAIVHGGNLAVNDGGAVAITDGGALYVTSATGNSIFSIYRTVIPDGSGRTQEILAASRDDGSPVLYIADLGTSPGHTHLQALVISDRAQNPIFAEDTVTGKGLAHPSLQACAWVNLLVPTVASVPTTTSTSWSPVQWGDAIMLQPKFDAGVLYVSDVGTTGQVRMTIGGVQVGNTLNISNGIFSNDYFSTAAWPSYAFEGRTIIQLEVRVTSGTGNVGAAGMGLFGRGS